MARFYSKTNSGPETYRVALVMSLAVTDLA